MTIIVYLFRIFLLNCPLNVNTTFLPQFVGETI